jgi:vacuolar-type H+-ATPase subunit H
MKEALETIKTANEAVDEAVNKLLTEAAEMILKEY